MNESEEGLKYQNSNQVSSDSLSSITVKDGSITEAHSLLSPASPTASPLSSTKKKGKRGVTALQLTMMIYFFTSGGPFGIEPAIGAAGPLLTMISLVVVPLLWSLPQALLSAELSLMVDENGGNVVWVQRAFGDFIGWVNAFNNLAASFSSMALLTVLFVDYFQYDFTIWEAWGIKIGFIAFVTVLNILGLRWISRLSVLFIVIIMAPFICEFVLVGKAGLINMKLLGGIERPIQWSLFLSTVIWSYGGFDSMGSLAAEVKGGRPTFLKGIAGSMPLIIANYVFPIAFGYFVDPVNKNWDSGYFSYIGNEVARWLGIFMIAASALSNFGQYNAAMAPLARVIASMAQEEGTAQKLPKFLGISWERHTGTIRPFVAIIFTGFMTALIAALPYVFLVQVFLIVRVVNLVCEYGALIRLRYSEPDTPRPFVVPGGLVGAWILGLPSAVLASLALFYADWIIWVTGIGINVLILVSYGIKKLIEKCIAKRRAAGYQAIQ